MYTQMESLGVTDDGALILRPWFDHLALRFMVRTYFPLSRLWAAAELAGDDLAAFAGGGGFVVVDLTTHAVVHDATGLTGGSKE